MKLLLLVVVLLLVLLMAAAAVEEEEELLLVEVEVMCPQNFGDTDNRAGTRSWMLASKSRSLEQSPTIPLTIPEFYRKWFQC